MEPPEEKRDEMPAEPDEEQSQRYDYTDEEDEGPKGITARQVIRGIIGVVAVIVIVIAFLIIWKKVTKKDDANPYAAPAEMQRINEERLREHGPSPEDHGGPQPGM